MLCSKQVVFQGRGAGYRDFMRRAGIIAVLSVNVAVVMILVVGKKCRFRLFSNTLNGQLNNGLT